MEESQMDELHGEDVLLSLAEIYNQLYIPPGDDSGEKYADVVKRGKRIPDGNLSHFTMDSRDSLIYENTPAGPVCIVTLYNRADFVTFLRIMGNRCSPVEIPDTQGASIIDGVINWTRIYEHKEEYFENELSRGNWFPDWNTEFRRFTSDKKNYLDTLIVLSVGPYSGISADIINDHLAGSRIIDTADNRKTVISEDEWLSLSDTIRRYHECTHFICRKRYPDKTDAIWDELVADATGIYAAFGQFDPGMEELFLGIRDGRYTGGRLENYIDEAADEKQRQLRMLSSEITAVLKDFEKVITGNPGLKPYDFAMLLEERKDCVNESYIPKNSIRPDIVS